MTNTISYSSLLAANTARQKEWDTNDQITMAYRGNELAGEVGEACNVIKKIERERMGIRGSRATVPQLAEELADIIICTDLIAMGAGIDLDAAVAHKFNQTSEKVGLRTRLAARETIGTGQIVQVPTPQFEKPGPAFRLLLAGFTALVVTFLFDLLMR